VSAPTLTDAEFETMKARFIAAGDRLSDLQLLDLADCYHEMLRQRRTGRISDREVSVTDPMRISQEDRTF
jgi:hypothetical protein